MQCSFSFAFSLETDKVISHINFGVDLITDNKSEILLAVIVSAIGLIFNISFNFKAKKKVLIRKYENEAMVFGCDSPNRQREIDKF